MDFNPLNRISDRINNIREHPFQNLALAGLGAANPLLGMAGRFLANRWNARQDANQFNDRSQDVTNRLDQQGSDMANNAMNQQLNGPLGQFDNSGLAGALLNARSPGGGWNMSQMFGPQQQGSWQTPGNPGGLLNFLPNNQPNGPDLSGLDEAMARSGGGGVKGGGGLGGGGYSGGGSWGGGFGGSMLSNLGMSNNVQQMGVPIGGFGGAQQGGVGQDMYGGLGGLLGTRVVYVAK